MLSLHYNGDDSYLFVNGRQELKFKCKTDQLVKEKLCIGNLSDQWTNGPMDYDMHRYLMTKHNISP